MNFSAQKGILAGLAAYDYLRSLSRPKESSQMTSEEFITKTMSANGVLIMDLSCKTAARSPADIERFKSAAKKFKVVIRSEEIAERTGGRPSKYKSKKASEEAGRIHSAERSREYRKRNGSASRLTSLGATDSTVVADANI